MQRHLLFTVALGAMTIALLTPVRASAQSATTPAPSAATPWHIVGTLSEACSCSVPCACNFGQNPSPFSYCYAITAMTVKTGNYGGTKLDGLTFAGAQGAKGFAFYIDAKADKEQRAALEAIARQMWLKGLKANGVTDATKPPPGFALLGFKTARIEHTSGGKANHVLVENVGRFDADYLIGFDGKTPVSIENNYSFNIQHNIKAKTRLMRWHDGYGNQFEFKETNSNQGDFDWSDTTPVYFR